MRVLNKIFCFSLIQIFFITNICFGFDSSIGKDTLAPVVNINSGNMLSLFSSLVELEQELNIENEYSQSQGVADNLNQGYEKLKVLVHDLSKTKHDLLLVCIDAVPGAGKTTFLDLIRNKGLGSVGVNEIEFLNRDKIIWDLVENEDCSYFEAYLELPFIVADKIAQARKNKKVLIYEGIESFYLFKDELKIATDIGIIIEVDDIVRFKRNVISLGLVVGIRQFLNSDFFKNVSATAENTLKIKNSEDPYSWPYVIVLSLWRTITVTIEYLMPQSVVDTYTEIRDNLFGKVRTFKNEVNFIDLILSPLYLGVYAFSKLLDFYYFIYSDYDMVQIIKNRFGNKIIQVLDVGTGNGEFIEKFQNVLSVKGIDAIIQGIDNKAAAIVKARENGVLARVMDVWELKSKLGGNRFDIITINAPDSPAGCVEQAMQVLKHDGILILRTAKPFITDDDQKKLVKNLSVKFDISQLKRKIYNLPNGFFYKLHKPLIIMHKAQAGLSKNNNLEFVDQKNGNAHDIYQNLEKQINKSKVIIKAGELVKVIPSGIDKGVVGNNIGLLMANFNLKKSPNPSDVKVLNLVLQAI